MKKAKSGDMVRVFCTGKLHDGREFDLAEGRKPIELIIGHGDLLQELEHAIIGMTPGEWKEVVIPKERGYGLRKEDLIQVVDRDHFPKGIDPKVGLRVRVPADSYNVIHATITEVTDSRITLDGNHPLAGEDLLCRLSLLEILTFDDAQF